MTERERFGLLCNRVFIKLYESTEYQKEDGSFSFAHEKRMRELVAGYSVQKRVKTRLMWIIAAVLLTLAILGGTIAAFYDHAADEIVLNGYEWAIETPSRILFFQNGKGKWMSDEYIYEEAQGLCYYSKADGKSYVYCNDPLCDHTSCPARTFTLEESLLIGDRFYAFEEKENGGFIIRSFGIDTAEVRVDWDSQTHLELSAYRYDGYSYREFAYGKYLFAWMETSDGARHTLRFDTESGKMEDLTEKSGHDFIPTFGYDNMLYGYDAESGGYVKTDLSLSAFSAAEDCVRKAFAKENEKGESTRFLYELVIGHRLYGTVIIEKENGKKESVMQVLDMKEGKVSRISDEAFGRDAVCVLYADDKYLYYLADEPVYVGKTSKYDLEVYNDYGGKIYRAKLDGSESECIFEDAELNFYAGTRAHIQGDDFLIQAAKITAHDSKAKVYASGVYIGHFDGDGKIESLDYADVIS